MSVPMKKRRTNESVEVVVFGPSKKIFSIPRNEMSKLIGFLNALQEREDNELVPAAEAFKNIIKKYGKVGVHIRGLRGREGLTQIQLAEKLGIKQSHISQMEHSKRPVGKKLAQKLGQLFNIDYRLFL